MRLSSPLLVLTLGIPVTGLVGQNPADSAAVVAVVNSFHAAFAVGDSAAVLRLLAPDVLVLEAGSLETLAEYRAHHLPADIAFARAVASSRTAKQIVVHGDAAWAIGTSEAQGTFRERTVRSSGVELLVLSREHAGWRIRAIHWSSRRPSGP
jgi:ketosteroid isomerase-like protein